ncbi:MAG: DUF3526 domain-containing protein [Saprospiraceae bacterium]
MTSLLIKKLLRSKGLMLGLLLLFFTGLISLHIGKIFLNQQSDTVTKTAQFQDENLQRHLKHIDGEIGLLLYYIRFGLVNETPRLAGLAIGHRDIHPSVQSVNIRNLEEQKYASELKNPLYQLLGNIDFSFVLIYLFPLIIIAFCFNILSEEKENGTWKLVLSQSEKPLQVIRTKLFIRSASVFLTFFILLFIGKIHLKIPMNIDFAAFAMTGVLYLTFWFALVWFMISLQKPSSQNALLLLLSWIALTIIIPTSVNALVVNLYPVPEAFNTVLDSRDGYHNKWDQPKAPTIKKFKEHYPQFAKYEHPEGKSFGWFWYFAMQQMGDDEAADASKTMKTKLQKRDKFSRTIGYLFPSIHTQFTLNSLGRSDLNNYLNFLNQLELFHETKRLYFYPKIFESQPIDSEDWGKVGLEYFKDNRIFDWFNGLFPLIFGSLLLLLLAKVKWSSI